MQKDWTPQNVRVVVLGLGLSDWDDPSDPIGHRDAVLYKFFRQCGVGPDHILHIRDEGGDRDSLMDTLPDFLADSDEDTLFIFYYAGHGEYPEDSEWDYDYDLSFCHPSENSFTLADLVGIIEENFNGYNVLMIADCCQSGNIARFAAEADSEYYYAGLTSALADNSSTGSWTFTDCLLEALTGNAEIDLNEDGTISLKELAKYAKSQMKDIENQKSDFGFTDGFEAEMSLAIAQWS